VLPGVVYLWGCAGGLLAGTFVYLLPLLVNTALAPNPPQLNRERVMAMVLIVTCVALSGGFVPLIPDQVTRGQAISLGLASQAIIKGLIRSVADGLPSRPP
jgi:hypothetical protein